MRILATYGSACFVGSEDIVIKVNLNKSVELPPQNFVFNKSNGSHIVTVSVSDNGKYLFAGYANKAICCWDILTGLEVGSGNFKKRPTTIIYSALSDSQEAILVADKTGDIWAADVPLFKKQIILAGHTASVITDMAKHGSLVVSSDRDEKIRLSRFPDLETIVSYCLGHTNVISSTSFAVVGEQVRLVSASWDHQLCLWDPENGALLSTFAYENTAAATEEANKVETSEDAVVVESVSSAVVDANAVSEGAVGGDEEVEDEQKTYDENTAGNYPFKVATATVSDQAVVAVIFKGLSTVKLYQVRNDSFSAELVVELPAVPSDIIFIGGSKLVALLPQPHCLQVLEVRCVSGSTEVVNSSAEYSGVAEFQQQSVERGVDFSQVSDLVDVYNEEKGLKKHTLDKPFDRQNTINYEKKRGAKRSKKNNNKE